MTSATHIIGSATGVSYDMAPAQSPSHIPLHNDSSPVTRYSPRVFFDSQPRPTSEGLTLNHPPLTAINTSFQHMQPTTFNEIGQYFDTASPNISLSRTRAFSASSTSIGSGPDIHVYQQSYTTDNTEPPHNGDFNDHALSCTTSYSDSHNSGSQSNEELDMPFTTRNETLSAQRHKRRRPARTTDTLITEKSARDKLAIAFGMLRESLPEHIRSMRCGRANFLGEASDWIREIRTNHDHLEAEYRALQEMNQNLQNLLRNCSCGPVRQQNMNHTIATQHQQPTNYYNSGESYATNPF